MGDRVMWFNGAVVPWGKAWVHVWDESALRGANVFEGITAFWDTDTRKHQVPAGPAHLDRLFDSAHLADIPTAATRPELWSALADSVDGVEVDDAAATATARTPAADHERLCRGNHVLSKVYLTPLT